MDFKVAYLNLREGYRGLCGGLDVDCVARPADAGVVGAAVRAGRAFHENQVTGVVKRVTGEGGVLLDKRDRVSAELSSCVAGIKAHNMSYVDNMTLQLMQGER